jgi:uncharacterized protein YgiM (DUF1202 family)
VSEIGGVSGMLEVFVIAFINCTGQSCAIAYPRPDQTYHSYTECKAQVASAPVGQEFDSQAFQGSELACMEVPDRVGATEWMALETTNLRQGPSVDAAVIDTVKRGTTFRVIAQERKWLSIQTAAGVRGFLWSDRAKKIRGE